MRIPKLLESTRHLEKFFRELLTELRTMNERLTEIEKRVYTDND